MSSQGYNHSGPSNNNYSPGNQGQGRWRGGGRERGRHYHDRGRGPRNHVSQGDCNNSRTRNNGYDRDSHRYSRDRPGRYDRGYDQDTSHVAYNNDAEYRDNHQQMGHYNRSRQGSDRNRSSPNQSSRNSPRTDYNNKGQYRDNYNQMVNFNNSEPETDRNKSSSNPPDAQDTTVSYQSDDTQSNFQRPENATQVQHLNERKRPASDKEEDDTSPHSSKRPNNVSIDFQTLSPDQLKKEVEEQFKCQHDNVQNIDNQAFIRPDDWGEKLKRATEHALLKAETKAKEINEIPSDDESCDSGIIGGYDPTRTRGLSELQRKFLRGLYKCHLMMLGFHVDSKLRVGADEVCLCPCSRQAEKWRMQNKVELEKYEVCNSKKKQSKKTLFQPYGLVNHLRTVGNQGCMFHYGAFEFLYNLYGDYYGTIGHEALYPLNSGKYKDAISAADRKRMREKRQLIEMNECLAKEKEDLTVENAQLKADLSDLEKVNKTLFEMGQRLKDDLKNLNIERSEKQELTEHELRAHKRSILWYFDTLRCRVEPSVKNMKVCVTPDPSRKCSFLLQPFIDDLYFNNRKEGVWNKTDFNRCRQVLFNDIDCKEKTGKMLPNKITDALILDWNVVYTKIEDYGKSRKAKAMATAIDKGGPSRQLLSDVFMQMETLRIPVLGKYVGIFEQDTAEGGRENVLQLIPQSDDFLFNKVNQIVNQTIKELFQRAIVGKIEENVSQIISSSDCYLANEVEEVIKMAIEKKSIKEVSAEIEALVRKTMIRIELYSRAMGRILV